MSSVSKEQRVAVEKSIELVRDSIFSGRMSTEEFIDEFCYIENKDDVNVPVIKFGMWPAQRAALKAIEEKRHTIILKARQIGLTWLVLCYIVHCCIKHKGFTVFVLSETEDKAKELINRVDLILRYLPMWLIIDPATHKQLSKDKNRKYEGLYYAKTTTELEIVRPDGENSKIKAEAATEGAARSMTGNIVFFDEWAYHRFAEETYTAAEPTIARPNSGKFIGLSTNKRGSLFESLWKNNLLFHKIFLDCYSDPNRNEKWYQDQCLALGSKVQQEFPRTEEEALLAGDNVSFPEWSKEIHVCAPFDIPKHWFRFGAVDNGYNNPFAWYKLAVSDDGIVYVYYEFSRWDDEPQIGYSDQARIFAEDLNATDDDGNAYREKLGYVVAGRDAYNTHHRDQSGKTLIDYYRSGGLKREGFTPAITDRKLRAATLHEYLKPYLDVNTGKMTAKLQVFNTCKYLISTIPQLVNDPRNPECVADMSDIDNCLTGDTIVDTPDGGVPIKNLVGITGNVCCYDEKRNIHTVSRFFDVRKTRKNAVVYKITTEDNREIRATEYHPVLTSNGWKTVSELTTEDSILDIFDNV
jgi:hypothetical protein